MQVGDIAKKIRHVAECLICLYLFEVSLRKPAQIRFILRLRSIQQILAPAPNLLFGYQKTLCSRVDRKVCGGRIPVSRSLCRRR